jgi:hypothetical protein
VTKRLTIGLSVFVLLVVGIGLGVHLSSKPSWKTDAPTVGQCWVGLASSVGLSVADGLHAVDCSAPHSNQTIAVERIPASVTGYPTGEVPLFTPSQYAKMFGADFRPILGNMKVEIGAITRLSEQTYVPTFEQWKQGARWVRVDMYMLGTGAPANLHEPDVSLIGTIESLVAAAQKNPDLINMCVDTASNTQLPRGANAQGVVADCATNPRWHLLTMTNLKKTGEAFPGSAEVSARSKAACEAFRSAGVYAIAYYGQDAGEVSQAEWDATNSLYAGCWISKKP